MEKTLEEVRETIEYRDVEKGKILCCAAGSEYEHKKGREIIFLPFQKYRYEEENCYIIREEDVIGE